MAEPRRPEVREDPFAADLSLEERLHALEAAGGEPLSGQGGMSQRLAEQAAFLEALAAEVAAQRERLRDQEKSLVERIADVDDDRRLSNTQLQRVWQSGREELEARLSRHGRVTLVALFLALAGSGLVALYAHWRTPAAGLAAEVATLREDVQRLSGVARQDTELQERLAAIAAALGEVSGSAADGPALAARLDQLAAEQRRQESALAALQRSLQPGVAATPSGPASSAAPPPATASQPLKPVAPEPAPKAAQAPAPPGMHQLTVTDRPFALQLSGGRNRDKILEMAARPDLPARVYVYEDTRRGRPWFVLIHSLYKSRAEAQAAVAQLPPKVRPWIRSLPSGAQLEMIQPRAGRD
ncbi:SPOR domain-containing protein [uncultured Thiodictyon sp.]|uniref:SPOR domain-containing protein n=1 Tax=uncultured Thiodictyon sp. TaxID=1846217 RepID=UPI0025F45C37|nr:SPOR domain-containing protein [uncultured Thiodictyon sp.]